jgi:hypothetical protein
MGISTLAPEELPGTRQLLRHSLATIAYRGGKVVRGAPEGFSGFRAGETTRTPGQILAHIGDLLEWSARLVNGSESWRAAWRPVPPQNWDQDVARFFNALQALDDSLQASQPLRTPADILFQGPISDALTHVGQLAMLRGLAGSPVRGETFILSEIAAGRVGPDQATPKREFD